MPNRILIVVDMQRDFIDGALANPAAQAIVPLIAKEISEGGYDSVFFTEDRHAPRSYAKSQEGRLLPVPHCLAGTPGVALEPTILGAAHSVARVSGKKPPTVVSKDSFGSIQLAQDVRSEHPTEVVLVGTCTDICVISNALILKAAMPEVPVRVIPWLCAGTSPEAHAEALRAMRRCQVIVPDEEPK